MRNDTTDSPSGLEPRMPGVDDLGESRLSTDRHVVGIEMKWMPDLQFWFMHRSLRNRHIAVQHTVQDRCGHRLNIKIHKLFSTECKAGCKTLF